MGFIGYTRDGIPCWDDIKDVPDTWIDDGNKFGVRQSSLPFTPRVGEAVGVETQSPVAFALIVAAVVILALILAIAVIVLNIIMVIFGPKQGRQLDENTFETFDGELWEKQLDGTWKRIKGKSGAAAGLLETAPVLIGGVIVLAGAVVGLTIFREVKS
jgi:hypothetical protein